MEPFLDIGVECLQRISGAHQPVHIDKPGDIENRQVIAQQIGAASQNAVQLVDGGLESGRRAVRGFIRDAVAGGGLADGRGLAAALAFGAQGVWMGTRFIATPESRSHQNYKERLVSTDSSGTVITRAHSGKPCRLIDNNYTRFWADREDEILPYPLQVRKYGEPASDLGRIDGDVENGVLPAGQSVGLIHEVKSAGDIVRDVVAEAEAALKRIAL